MTWSNLLFANNLPRLFILNKKRVYATSPTLQTKTKKYEKNNIYQIVAITSISTKACFGSSLTANAQRAGYTSLNSDA